MTARRTHGYTLAAAAMLLAAVPACLGDADPLFCDDDATCTFSDKEWARLQTLTNLGPPPRDPTNAADGDAAAIALGRAFFADARFSGLATQVDALRRSSTVARAPRGQPTNLSCVSCHDLGRAGVDTASVPGNVSSGAGWTDVNALPIVNCAYQRLFTWNGRADSLWAQAFAVAESATTMNGNRLRTATVIRDDPRYRADYEAVFGPLALDASFPSNGKPGAKPGCQPGDSTEPFGDAWDCLSTYMQVQTTRVLVNWAKALAAYEATLVSRYSRFDRFMREGPRSTAIDLGAQRGARLFVGKAGCVDCHGTPLLSDRDFHNVGVQQAGAAVPTEADCPAGGACDCTGDGKNCLPWGALDGLRKLGMNPMGRTSMWSDDPRDTSRAADARRPMTEADALKGAWRTPSLRNVALTAPYMHDGIYATLEQVVAHYARGGDATTVGTRAVEIKPLRLGAREQNDLVAFLQTLTETPGGPGPPDAGTDGDARGPRTCVATPPPTTPALGIPCSVESVLNTSCRICHSSPPGGGAPMAMVTYADLVSAAPSNRNQTVAQLAVQRMKDATRPMPPYPYPRATAAEIQALESWVGAGSPQGPMCAGAAAGGGVICPPEMPDAGAGPPDVRIPPRPDAGAADPTACLGEPPRTRVIAGDPASPANLAFYAFNAPGLAAPVVTWETGPPPLPQALVVVANPGTTTDAGASYVGVGLPFGNPPCVDASKFTAVSFTIDGDLGSCTLRFGVLTSRDNAVENGAFGRCTLGAACVPPFSAPIGLGTNVVRFSEMTGGNPMNGVDATALNGVQWLLTVPTDPGAVPCSASLRIRDVWFVDDRPSCPATSPVISTPCPAVPLGCQYPFGAACSCLDLRPMPGLVWTCSNSPGCPPRAPEAGIPCGPPGPVGCYYPCSPSLLMATTTTCVNGSWTVASESCSLTPPP